MAAAPAVSAAFVVGAVPFAVVAAVPAVVSALLPGQPAAHNSLYVHGRSFLYDRFSSFLRGAHLLASRQHQISHLLSSCCKG